MQKHSKKLTCITFIITKISDIHVIIARVNNEYLMKNIKNSIIYKQEINKINI